MDDKLGSVSKKFFFEKKNQKTFTGAVADSQDLHPSGNKSFLPLFFKKEGLPSK
jgi:hypothetical protein